MHFIAFSELWLRHLSEVVSLPWFVLIGSFAEEMISPIPSLLVMGTAGTIAFARGLSVWHLLGLSFIGNIGKTMGAYIYYVIGDKLEDLVVPRYGKYFGVTHKQIEEIGKKFTGTWKDAALLFLLRITPFFPTTTVSVVCGILKMRLSEYLSLTFVANCIKDFMYLLVGYAGLAAIGRLWRDIDDIKFFFHVAIGIGILVLLYLLWNHRRKGIWLWERLCRWRRGH
jgi:membrane protein DedA with SNARE-associated domain